MKNNNIKEKDKKKNRRKYKDVYKEKKYNYLSIILGIIIAVIPLLVMLNSISIKGTVYSKFTGIETTSDFFSFYKMLGILISTVLVAILFLQKFVKDEIKRTKLYIPMGTFALFIILSTIFSGNKGIALFGYVDRFEGMFVLLAYLILLFITINVVNNEWSIRAILLSLSISVVVISLIGIFQYFGHDFYVSSFGKFLILPGKYSEMANTVKTTLEPNTFYSSLYHYNYVGSYMAMMFPFALIVLLLSKERNLKIITGVLVLLTFSGLFMAKSRAGIVGTTVAAIMMLILLRKYIIKRWKLCVVGLLAAVIMFIGINAVSNGSISKRLATLVNDIIGIASEGKENKLKDIKINGTELSIVTSENPLKVVLEDVDIAFRDEANNKIIIKYNDTDGEIVIKDQRYKDYKVHLLYENNIPILQIQNPIIFGDVKYHFAIMTTSFKFINNIGEAVDLKTIPKFGFEGKERLGSARGYIWSRSIPMLKSTLLVGKGPDTFAEYFPQDDYIGKQIAYDTPYMFVDKPHNLYIQTGINTGVISLIAMLALFLMYFIQSMKIYLCGEFNSNYKVYGLGIFVAVCGYLGAGFFNDSVVSVAPVFWILLGIGISINLSLNREKTSINQ